MLSLAAPKPTTISLFMGEKSIKNPMVALYDVIVKVDHFIFLSYFVILDL